MKILKEEDPGGCEYRRKKKLKRRIYRNQVITSSMNHSLCRELKDGGLNSEHEKPIGGLTF
jgi:hypothetical protein